MSAINLLASQMQQDAAKELMKTHRLTEMEAVNMVLAVALSVRNDKQELFTAAVRILETRKK